MASLVVSGVCALKQNFYVRARPSPARSGLMFPFRQANPVRVIEHKVFIVQVCRDRLLYPPAFSASLRGENPDQRFPVHRLSFSLLR